MRGMRWKPHPKFVTLNHWPEQEPEYDPRSLLGLHGVPVVSLQRVIFRIGLLALAMAALIVVFVVLATT